MSVTTAEAAASAAEMGMGMEMERRAYARVGLLGNPSDVYGGRALSFTVADFSATVRLRPSPDLLIQPHPHHDLVAFPSLPKLVSRLQSEGYYGGVRLLMAICKVFYNHCIQNNISLKAENFTLSYDTNIPRQAGLSGSSAIVCAALSCLLDFYDVRHLIKVETRPNLILSAEKELGIVAGLQDRVAQVYGGLVYMDFSQEHMDKLGHGIYMPLDVNLLPPLYLIYAENPSDSGKVHSTVRQRWLDGDEFIISRMKEVAQVAFDGHKALLQKDYTELARLMNKNFDLRREMFGDDVLGSVNIKMVEVARSVGAASKFTGSGGAVVALCPDGDSQVERLGKACQEAGFVVQQVKVAPSVLTDEELSMGLGLLWAGGWSIVLVSSSSSVTARALELGYAAVALDHPHRGLLADSHRCRTEPFAPLSSLPLPSSAALHRRRLASPASEPFRQYTRITLSLDSAAATASALAPSASRLLRTYDLVAARPLTQPAFDHLCQAPLSAQHLDLISIDFSSHGKLPFRIKPSMLKLALQKGLHFEIAYSPLISTDVNAKRNLIAEVKLLVDWTKGKNLIISSAAHTASQIRGPYDVINLSSYLLGIPIDRAKAAMSTNCRSLVLKAMRKKHFYKETIRIDRLLPNEELISTKFKLADWIGWNSVSSEVGATQLEPSSNFDELPGSPICGVIEGSHEKPHNPDLSVFAKLSEQPSDQDQMLSETQEETLQVDTIEVPTDCGQSILPASFNYQNAIIEKAESNEVFVNTFVQLGTGCFADPKIITKHVEFVQDAMEVDRIESCRPKLVVGDNIPSTSDTSTKLACSAQPHGRELSGTGLEDQGPSHSSEILANDKPYMKYYTDCTSGVSEVHEISSGADVWPEDKDSDRSNRMQADNEACRGTSEPLKCLPCGVDDKAQPHGIELSGTSLEDQGPSHSSEILANDKSYMKYHTDCTSGVSEVHEISSGADVWPEDKDSDSSNRMQADNEAYRGTSEPLKCPPCGVDDKAPSDLSFYSSHELCRDVIIQQKVMEGEVEQSRDENIVQTVANEAEETRTRTSISVEPTFHGQEISSTIHTRSTGASCESDELKEQNSMDINAFLDKSIAKTHELLLKSSFPYPSGKAGMSRVRPENRRHKLKPHHPAYLPFLGLLRSVYFKKKICKVACKRKS